MHFNVIYHIKGLGLKCLFVSTYKLFDIKLKQEEIGLFRLGSETSTKRNNCNLSID